MSIPYFCFFASRLNSPFTLNKTCYLFRRKFYWQLVKRAVLNIVYCSSASNGKRKNSSHSNFFWIPFFLTWIKSSGYEALSWIKNLVMEYGVCILDCCGCINMWSFSSFFFFYFKKKGFCFFLPENGKSLPITIITFVN